MGETPINADYDDVDDTQATIIPLVANPDDCAAHCIVMKVYGHLMQSGVGEREAVQICSRVLCHHQKCPSLAAKEVVECWAHRFMKKTPH